MLPLNQHHTLACSQFDLIQISKTTRENILNWIACHNRRNAIKSVWNANLVDLGFQTYSIPVIFNSMVASMNQQNGAHAGIENALQREIIDFLLTVITHSSDGTTQEETAKYMVDLLFEMPLSAKRKDIDQYQPTQICRAIEHLSAIIADNGSAYNQLINALELAVIKVRKMIGPRQSSYLNAYQQILSCVINAREGVLKSQACQEELLSNGTCAQRVDGVDLLGDFLDGKTTHINLAAAASDDTEDDQYSQLTELLINPNHGTMFHAGSNFASSVNHDDVEMNLGASPALFPSMSSR